MSELERQVMMITPYKDQKDIEWFNKATRDGVSFEDLNDSE